MSTEIDEQATPTRITVANRSASGEPRPGSCPVALGDDLTARLTRFAADHGVEPASVLLAGWALVLNRYAAQRDVTVAVDGRPVRVEVDGTRPAVELVRSVDRRAREVAAGELPVGEPLFDPAVVLDPALPSPSIAFDELVLARPLAERMAAHLVVLVGGLVAHPDRPVADLGMATDDELARLRAWNDTADGTGHALVHHRIQEQAARTPEAIAVQVGAHHLTYRTLVERASQVAHHLQAQGVRPGSFVGIMLPRSADLPVALLGTLLAGAAYVPLDPAYPAERIRFMTADAGADLVLTEDTVAAPAIATYPTTPPTDTVLPESAAYAIYTSGSTGTPKGAVVEHRNLAAFLHWATSAFTADELRSLVATTSICFDLSVYELFAPLCVGGAVLLVEDALQLTRPQPMRPTLVNSVPSAMETLVRMGQAPAVRTVNLAGEPLSRKLVEDLLAVDGVACVGNLYGPSETTIYSTAAFFESPGDAGETPPIGRPIANTTTWVLDDFGHPVPPGVPGELFIGGACVGRGYHGRPGLTAERFVPDPFAAEPGRRLYRTGDTVRWRDDGELEFLGRRDHQVKVRGYRIELPEIEVALLAHPRVREAAVLVAGTGLTDKVLAAFVVTSEPAPGAEQIERFLGERLPSYMVPQRITVLDRLPRTPNGKIDRAQLAQLAREGQPAPAAGTEASRPLGTPTEEALAEVWCSVLGLERVGPDDDFFHLGGQSLLAMQVVARVRDALGVELPLPVLFERRTLGAVAAALEGAGSSRRRSDAIVKRGRKKGPVSLVQRALLRNADRADIPAVTPVFRLSGDLDVAALEKALNELVRRHESLRTVYTSTAGRRHRQVVLPWTHTPLTPVELRGKNTRQQVIDNIVEPFDLATGPVIRWKLLRLAKQEHVLSIAVHEVAADGWSLPTMQNELAALYTDFSEGRPSSLPEPEVQYLDFALWQQRSMTKAKRRQQLRYWKERLATAPVGLDLVPDLAPAVEGAVTTPGSVELPLDQHLTERLRAYARDEGATLFMVLFAAFQALLHRYTGSPKVLVRPTVANRTSLQVEPVVGFFVNHLLLDTDVSGDPSFHELVDRVRRDFFDAAVNADVPLPEVLQRVAALKTARTNWPTGRIRFQLLNFPHDTAFSLPGLKVRQESADLDVSDHLGMFGFERTDGSVELALFYDGAAYSKARMARFVSHYRVILETVAADPGVRVSALPLLDKREVDTVVRAGQGPSHTASGDTLHGLVAEQAAKAPDAVALVHGGESVTYAELVDRARKLAAHLSALGVGPEDPVALAAEPSPAMVVGMLGILEAGAACVLDGAADASVAVTGVEGVTGAGAFTGPAVGEEQAALVVPCGGGRAAVLTHGAVAHAATWQRAAAGLRRTDRCTDLSGAVPARLPWSLWSALVAGATFVFPDEAAPDSAWLVDQRITVCVGDSEVAKRAVAAATGKKAPLRLVVADGPAFAPEGRPPVQVVEEWGPTETAGLTLTGERLRTADSPVFSGAPIGEADVFVLDPALGLLPVNEPGEICVDGPHVARGYLGDPRATALRFVPNPYSDRPGARLFRTGAVGRVSAKGRIDVLSRDGSDSARGTPMAPHLHRIEAAIVAHPEVEAVVAKVEPVLGEPRVNVYVQRAAGARVAKREVTALLPEDLPAWAKPMTVDVLDRFPRGADGRPNPRSKESKKR